MNETTLLTNFEKKIFSISYNSQSNWFINLKFLKIYIFGIMKIKITIKVIQRHSFTFGMGWVTQHF